VNARLSLLSAASFVLGVAVGAGALILRGIPEREALEKSAAFEALTQQKLARIEQLCAARPRGAGPDPVALASLVGEHLRGAIPLAGAAPPASAMAAGGTNIGRTAEAESDETENLESVVSAQKLIDDAVSARRWTPEDRERLRALLVTLPLAEHDRIMARIAHHLNTGEIVPTDDQPPY
jgi:hypothetical protein